MLQLPFCVLFDLDGTLVDTAPDLVAALNVALIQYQYSPVTIDQVREQISFGAMAMIQKTAVTTADQPLVLSTMLDYYQQHSVQFGGLFQGMENLLTWIEQQGWCWGVVTNKIQRFTLPLMQSLKLDQRAACIISGDTTPYPKPHPAPMLAACKQAGVNIEQCVYIGDAAHDVLAGKSVGMKTLAASYGYLPPNTLINSWGADAIVSSTVDIQQWLESCR